MLGGEDVNAIVMDVGSHSCKVGYAGEDTPRIVFPTGVGQLNSDNMDEQQKGQFVVGNQAMAFRRDNMEVVPTLKEGLYHDWDILQAIWDHAFREQLRIQTTEHPILMAEPSFVPKSQREKIVDLLFEGHNPPAVFLSKNAVLATFASGRQTSVVVDIGYEGTVVCGVHDGYVLQKSMVRSPVGGRLLSRCMQKCVEEKGVEIRPRWSFKKEEAPQGYQMVDQDLPNTCQSYRQYCVEDIASDIKESICRVSDSVFIAEDNTNIPTQTYELPDGTELQIGADRFKVPEVLFQPELLSTFQGLDAVENYDGSSLKSIHEMIKQSIELCDVDIRRDIFGGTLATGGSSMFTGLKDRLDKELSQIAPSTVKVKVQAPQNTLERKFAVWIGGSILASLGSFQQMWMSKTEYEEHGAGLIHRKSP